MIWEHLTSVGTISVFISSISILQVAVTTFLAICCIYYSHLRYRDVPPGPWGVPILGYWPFLRSKGGHLQIQGLREKFGEVFSFTVTGHLFICLSSFKAIKEAHLGKAECFADRYSDFSLMKLTFEDAVSLANGESYKAQRKFFQQKFKEYGMLSMKENFASPVYEVLQETVKEMRATEGQPIAITYFLITKCSYILRRILFQDRGITEDELKELNYHFGPVLVSMSHTNVLLMGNLARYLVFPFMIIYWFMLRSHYRIKAILGNIIHRHKKNFDENRVTNIIDSFYKEKRDKERKADPAAKYFTDQSLLSSIYQFSTDGVLTVAFFIGIFLDKLVRYPEEQEKIYQELLDVLGPDRMPTVEDKSSLPYTNAFIYEVIRFTDLYPMFPSLKCTRETRLRGYKIPKGAITVINLWSAHHDSTVYEDPYAFNPSRFIAGEKEAEHPPIIFGIGKRACMAEPFVLVQTFLFVATLVKNFKLQKPDGSDVSFTILTAGRVKICAHPRNEDRH